MRVVVAMSGGVDSSVAASLLVDAGHEVVGLSMQLYDHRESPEAFGSCCSLDDLQDARRVAEQLRIPYYLVNFEERFKGAVVDNFVREYAAGRTPIPCVHCNADLKFAALVDRATALDAAWVSTGHYARVTFDEDRRGFRLWRGVDPTKDQSYFLFSLTQEQLARALFPVGGLTKTAVRAYAADRRLPVANKPDSHEICFVPTGEAADFVGRHLGENEARTGAIVDSGGRSLGHHAGIHQFTVGQRRGLGLSTGVPLYVLRINPASAELVVGPRDELGSTRLTASGVNWIRGAAPEAPLRVTARIRHRHVDAAALVTPVGTDRCCVEFDLPQAAVTPGQAVVCYQGDEVIAGGWID